MRVSCIGVRASVPKMVSNRVQIGCKLGRVVVQMSRGDESRYDSRRDSADVWREI